MASKSKKKNFHVIRGTIKFDKVNRHRAVFILEDVKGLLSSNVIHFNPEALPKGAASGTYSFRFEIK